MITGKKRARRGTVLMLWSVPAVGVCLFFAGACTTPADPECVIDADCAANERCSAAGECILDDTPTNGEPDPECVIDADCGDDQVCNTNGVCIPDESGGPDPDPGEVECTTNSECNAGESCTPDGICVPDEGEAPCLLDSECNPDEVCTDAGFCADADDPDPPGPSDGGGGGGGGGGGVPTLDCTTNSDCAVDEVCQNGLCAPAPEQPNAAELLEGCWRITFTAPGLGSSVAVYQFDADGRLERTWGVSTPGGATTEEVRFTVPNATFFDGLYRLTEQVVSLDETLTALQISTGLISLGFGESQGRCLVQRTTVCVDLALIEATLSGNPPATIVSGTFVGSRTCVTTGNSPGETNNLYNGTITGERIDACPDITLPSVQSQEEQVDLCD